jgi:Protein of unknown function (DUF2853)
MVSNRGDGVMVAASDYFEDVKSHAGECDEGAVAGLVKYLGIALRNKDSSLVAGTDPKELDRIRDNFLKKKLALTESDEALDAAIAEVMVAMKGDRTKQRVTVYYMLAKKFGKLSTFG